jgi:hypothetical protein
MLRKFWNLFVVCDYDNIYKVYNLLIFMGFRNITLHSGGAYHLIFPDGLDEDSPIRDELISVVGRASERVDILYDTKSNYRFLPSSSVMSGNERLSETHLHQLRGLLNTVHERDYQRLEIGPRNPLILVPRGQRDLLDILLAYTNENHSIMLSPGSSYELTSTEALSLGPSRLRNLVNIRIDGLSVRKPRI